MKKNDKPPDAAIKPNSGIIISVSRRLRWWRIGGVRWREAITAAAFVERLCSLFAN